MPPPIARPVIQLDGSALGGSNCVPTSDAMNIDRSTAGKIRTTGAHVRALSGDFIGGCTLDEMRHVNRVLYNLNTDQRNAYLWDHLKDASQDQGFILLVCYDVISGSSHDCFRRAFRGNHAMWVNHWDAAKKMWYVADPGADGRYAGCPEGYQWYPDALLREAAGRLLISATTSARLGNGKAQVLFSIPDKAGATGQYPTQGGPIVTPAVPAKEPNVMIAPAWGTSSTKRMLLSKGQPCYRSPGGKRITAMSARVSVPFIGKAGTGWVAVLIRTKAPYKDKLARPTVVYVPAKAGPVS